jgi:hypothetical protein
MAEENMAWVLIEKGTFAETYRNFKKEIDSLTDTGNELHFFEPGFKKTDLIDITRDTTTTDTSAKLSYWSLLRLLEQQIPPGTKAYIFTGDRLNRFKGARPATTTAITWKTYSPSDSASRWIDHAYLSSSGDVRTIISESTPKGLLRKTVDINPGTSNADIKRTIVDGKPQVQLNDHKVIADTSTLTIAINAEGFPSDAEYLTAAISAIQKYTARKIELVKPSREQDILFWLSSKDLPSGLKAGSTVFQYAKGKAVSTNSWLEISDGTNPLQSEDIALHKRIAYPSKESGFSIWEDGYGKPILDLRNQNQISLYTFYTRLDPEWTDLVWSPEFVKLLIPIIVPKTQPIPQEKLDKRSIASIQMLPHSDLRLPTSDLRVNPVLNTLDLKYYLWILLMATFLIERFLSFRNNLT